jgi:mannose-1-phosphate guanylyltransferase
MTDLDLQAMLAFHRERESKLTIALTPVEDPTAFGLVETDATGRIRRFIEKPNRDEITTDMINAGTYIIEPDVFRYVPPAQYYMFERGLFPVLLQTSDPMYGYPARSYWTDVGKPQTYLEVHHDILIGKVRYQFRGRQIADRVWIEHEADIHPTAQIVGPVVLGADVKIGPGARIIGPTVMGARCVVGANVTIEGAVLWEDNVIEEGAALRSCVLGRGNRIGAKAHLADGTIISDGCVVGAENRLERGIRLWPETELKERAISF